MKYSYRVTLSISLLLLIALVVPGSSVASGLCRQVTLSFGSGKAEPNGAELVRFQRMLEQMPDQEYWVEISAHTDSDGSEAANQRLSEQRAAFVQNLVSSHIKQVTRFRVQAMGEREHIDGNETEAQRARNRRVEVSLLPLKSGKFVLRGAGGVEMKMDPAYFGDCPICDDPPSLTIIPDGESAEAVGIAMVSSDGRELYSAGMFQLNTSCNSQFPPKECGDFEVSFPALTNEPSMSLWTLNEDSSAWDPDSEKIRYDSDLKAYIVRLTCSSFSSGKIKNFDCPKVSLKWVKLEPSPNWPQDGYAQVLVRRNLLPDTTLILYPGDSIRLQGSFVSAGFVHLDQVTTIPPTQIKLEKMYSPNTNCTTITRAVLQEMPLEYKIPVDTMVRLRLKGFPDGYEPAFWVSKYEIDRPLSPHKKNPRKFNGKAPVQAHQMRFIKPLNGEPFDYKQMKTRFRKRKRFLKVKLKFKDFVE